MGRKERKNKSKTSAFSSHRFMAEPPAPGVYECLYSNTRVCEGFQTSVSARRSFERISCERTKKKDPPRSTSGGRFRWVALQDQQSSSTTKTNKMTGTRNRFVTRGRRVVLRSCVPRNVPDCFELLSSANFLCDLLLLHPTGERTGGFAKEMD